MGLPSRTGDTSSQLFPSSLVRQTRSPPTNKVRESSGSNSRNTIHTASVSSLWAGGETSTQPTRGILFGQVLDDGALPLGIPAGFHGSRRRNLQEFGIHFQSQRYCTR